MQLISFIAFVMTVFFFVCLSEKDACAHVEKSEDMLKSMK